MLFLFIVSGLKANIVELWIKVTLILFYLKINLIERNIFELEAFILDFLSSSMMHQIWVKELHFEFTYICLILINHLKLHRQVFIIAHLGSLSTIWLQKITAMSNG